ncbi:hypothetical protein [Streptomyces sp. NPDC046759]|uniref:hypothetical protein n=1 Tax=Streptomyces sp. NPDC046759 TaxID=3155019 RepID=UPI0033FCECEB
MSDRTSGPGDEHPTGRAARDPLPEERLPGEPPAPPGSAGYGREGVTADDRTPADAPPYPPGPAGVSPTDGRTASGTADSGTAASGTAIGGSAAPGGVEPTPGGGIPMEGAPRGGPAGRGAVGGGSTYGDSPMPDDGLGVPSSGEVTAREAHTTESRAPDAWPTAPGGAASAPAPSGIGAPLLPHDETDRWEQRMRQVAAGFVDEPRGAVEQADHMLEEIVGRFGEAVARRRRTLRRSWEASEDRGPGSEADTELLRLALRDYRELAGRLLHL